MWAETFFVKKLGDEDFFCKKLGDEDFFTIKFDNPRFYLKEAIFEDQKSSILGIVTRLSKYFTEIFSQTSKIQSWIDIINFCFLKIRCGTAM